MELDFKTVKALSSPTRIEILRSALKGETTTTQISDELGKSKSTVSSHLKTLSNAGLLEKDEKEGRKRVSYVPTGKAKAIVEGRERSVKFSIATGFLFAIIGTASVGRYALSGFVGMSANSADSASGSQNNSEALTAMDSGSSSDQMNSLMMESAEKGAQVANNTAETANSVFEPELVFLAAGVLFLSTSALTFAYGYLMNRLGN